MYSSMLSLMSIKGQKITMGSIPFVRNDTINVAK